MTGTTKPRIASGKKDLTFGLAGYREEVQMDQEKRNPILSIDLQIRLRGAVYEINLTRVLKWLGVLVVAGLRIYRSWYGASG
jgi:hypothetical protein